MVRNGKITMEGSWWEEGEGKTTEESWWGEWEREKNGENWREEWESQKNGGNLVAGMGKGKQRSEACGRHGKWRTNGGTYVGWLLQFLNWTSGATCLAREK